MSSTQPTEIVCAYSPDSDDAFMFYALATRKIRSPRITFQQVLEDIQTLNRKAAEGAYELTAISYHAYAYVADKYSLMASGSSVGDGYGPVLASPRPATLEDVKGRRVAVPGLMTTAYLTLRLAQPDFEAVPVPFDRILQAVDEGTVDFGLVIHEAQLTYAKSGYHSVVDLGRWWKKTYGLPLPLGANALRRNLPEGVGSECCRMMRESIAYALEHHDEAFNYALQFARDTEPALAEKFVGMYVNHHTLDCGEDVPRAAQKLFDLGFEAGVIPHRVSVDFIR